MEGKYLEKEKIFLWRRKTMETMKQGKGGKYLERENVTMAGQTTNKERSGFFWVKFFLVKIFWG